MKMAVQIAILGVASVCYAQVQDIPFREQYDFKWESIPLDHLRLDLTASIESKAPLVHQGEGVTLRYTLTALRGAGDIFNPFLIAGTRQPAILAIFDSSRTFLGDLLVRRRESYIGVSPSLWFQIIADRFIGRTLGFTAGIIETRPEYDGILVDGKKMYLPPGRYYVQLIFTKELVRPRPDKTTENYDQWFNTLDWEAFRSNIVEIDIIAEQTGTSTGDVQRTDSTSSAPDGR